MEEARELQLTARRCTNPCSDPGMSRAFARFKARMVENIVRTGIGLEEALERMRKIGEFEGPRCAMTGMVLNRCVKGNGELHGICYEDRIRYYLSGSAELLEANNIISKVADEIFRATLQREGAQLGIDPQNLYPGTYCFPIHAQYMGAFLENGHYDIGVAVLGGALSHAVMVRALGLDVLYVRAKRRGARVEFEPMCDLEGIRGKRTLIIEDDMRAGRTMRKVVSELRRFGPAEIEIGLFSNTNPRVGETFMGCRIAYDYLRMLQAKDIHYDEETEYAAIARLLNGLRQ